MIATCDRCYTYSDTAVHLHTYAIDSSYWLCDRCSQAVNDAIVLTIESYDIGDK